MNFIEDVLERFPSARPALVTISRDGERRVWGFGELIARSAGLSGAYAGCATRFRRDLPKRRSRERSGQQLERRRRTRPGRNDSDPGWRPYPARSAPWVQGLRRYADPAETGRERGSRHHVRCVCSREREQRASGQGALLCRPRHDVGLCGRQPRCPIRSHTRRFRRSRKSTTSSTRATRRRHSWDRTDSRKRAHSSRARFPRSPEHFRCSARRSSRPALRCAGGRIR